MSKWSHGRSWLPLPVLAGYWAFDNGQGTVATDSSGQQPPNNGTLVAGPTWTTGKVGGALAFDGSNDLVDVHDSPSLDISGGITLAAWIKPNAVATQRVITKDYGTANGYELSLSSSGHAFVRFNHATSGDTYRLDAKASYPTDGNTWVHLAATYDGATIKIYVNGVLDNSKATTFTIGTNNVDLGLGADVGSGSGTNTLHGQMDEARIYNGALSAQEIQALTVNQAPAITSANSTTFTVGTAGSFAVMTTGVPTPTLSETGTLPMGVTFNLATGVLSGTPAAGTVGTYPLTFTAANGVTPNATQSFTLTVNQAPAITSANSTTFTTGAAGSFKVTTTGVPTPTLSESGKLPSGVTFVDNGNGTATLGGTPAAGSGGTYTLAFTAANGFSATQSFTLTVNQAPAITSTNSTTFTVGTADSFAVTTTGFPTPALTAGTLPTGVTFVDNGNGTATLASTTATPAGSTMLTITASNGVGSDATQSFTLTVAAQAPAMITSAGSTTFTAGTLGTFTVTTNGVPNPALTESGKLPSGVTFDATTGVLSGTPAAGTVGTYSLHFTASNGVGSSTTQNFTLTVNQAPAITSANSTTFAVGAAGSFKVTTTGVPTPTLSESGKLPHSGVTFDATTGVLSGTPASNTGGVYNLTFTAHNGAGSDATQPFTLTVNPATPTLVGYWRFDDGTGTVATDSSGQQPPNNGTLVAGPTWTTGKVGGALALDGVQ